MKLFSVFIFIFVLPVFSNDSIETRVICTKKSDANILTIDVVSHEVKADTFYYLGFNIQPIGDEDPRGPLFIEKVDSVKSDENDLSWHGYESKGYSIHLDYSNAVMRTPGGKSLTEFISGTLSLKSNNLEVKNLECNRYLPGKVSWDGKASLTELALEKSLVKQK